MEHLQTNIEDFIERYYNKKRLHSALGYLSPEKFEARQTGDQSSKTATIAYSFGRASTLLDLGTGTQTPSPSPDPNPLAGGSGKAGAEPDACALPAKAACELAVAELAGGPSAGNRFGRGRFASN
jgi:hypothetical protein